MVFVVFKWVLHIWFFTPCLFSEKVELMNVIIRVLFSSNPLLVASFFSLSFVYKWHRLCLLNSAFKKAFIFWDYLGAVTGLSGVFTNSDVLLTNWNALQWLYPTDCTWSASNVNFFLCLFTRYDVSQGEWVRCNVHIQKMCHYPVFGLKEGSLYQFRVCAVNKAGVGRPSKATDPIRTADPLKHTRTAGKWWTGTKLQKFFLLLLCTYSTDIMPVIAWEHDRSIYPSIHLNSYNVITQRVCVGGGGGEVGGEQMGCVQMLWMKDRQNVDRPPVSPRWLPVAALLTLTLMVLSWALT